MNDFNANCPALDKSECQGDVLMRSNRVVDRATSSVIFVLLVFVSTFSLPSVALSQEQDVESLIMGALEKYLDSKLGNEQAAPQPHSSPLIFNDRPESQFEEFKSLHVQTTSGSGSSSNSTSRIETDCFNLVQDRIAWNAQGNRRWSPSSIKTLCKGTTTATQPPRCFDQALNAPQVWRASNKQQLTWSSASALCAGSNNASRTLRCFKQSMRANNDINAGIKLCSKKGASAVSNWGSAVLPTGTMIKPTIITPTIKIATPPKLEKECFSYVQNNIAWDAAKKSKKWADSNVKRLCKGTTSKYSPGNCFKYVMHQGRQWGRKSNHKMSWSIALDACEGTSNAKQTTSCFKSAIANNLTTSAAAKKCDVR